MHDMGKLFVPGTIAEPPVRTVGSELDNHASAFAVHCSSDILGRIMEYAVRHKLTEVFGLLLGEVFRTPNGKLRTVVREFIPAQRLQASTATFVEVSAEELIRMDHAFEETSGTKGFLKIGWFHTHPGHGIFMSSTDKENHQMYQKPWQVALVVDPTRCTSGFFAGTRCEPIPVISPPVSDDTGVASNNASVVSRRNVTLLLAVVALTLADIVAAAASVVAYRKADRAQHRLSDIEKHLRLMQSEMEMMKTQIGRERGGAESKRE
ncbi:MAG: Mov34/MPN/PAD-1 family protein [Candidatus Solibacter sp.]|jgi:proteasome lid subunit RPN8/RPN11